MKEIVIKVIKRKAPGAEIASAPRAEPRSEQPATLTSTINDWIAQSRQSKLDSDNSSREMIAAWAADITI